MKLYSLLWHAATSLILTGATFGQSCFDFANYNPPFVDAPVFDAQGRRLAGPNYFAELYGGGMTNSLTPLAVFNEGNRREIVPFFNAPNAGYVLSGTAFLSVLEVPAGGWAWLQLRAWDARLGGTYEQAAALGVGGYGESVLFYAKGGNPRDLLGPFPGPLIGLQSFSLLPEIPEPSAAWLLLLGLSWFFFHRRRRR